MPSVTWLVGCELVQIVLPFVVVVHHGGRFRTLSILLMVAYRNVTGTLQEKLEKKSLF